MTKQSKKHIIKEWIDLMLCDMLDEVLRLMKEDKSKTEIMKVIKRYSMEIYNSYNSYNY